MLDNLTNAIHMLKKKITRMKSSNANESFIKGYEKAIRDVTWLKGKVDKKEEKQIEDYFKVDRRTAKLKRIAEKYSK